MGRAQRTSDLKLGLSELRRKAPRGRASTAQAKTQTPLPLCCSCSFPRPPYRHLLMSATSEVTELDPMKPMMALVLIFPSTAKRKRKKRKIKFSMVAHAHGRRTSLKPVWAAGSDLITNIPKHQAGEMAQWK